MRLTGLRWLAVSSALLCVAANAETRPRYGGVLRIETQQAIDALPQEASGAKAEGLARQVAVLIHPPAGCGGKCAADFRVAEFVPGRKLTLVANDDSTQGRPYLDAIEIRMGRAAREQRVALQLGQADVIELPVEGWRRAAQEGVRVSASQPVELIAVVGAGEWREALAQAVDRGAIHRVLLQQQGEPTSALAPNWMTGYAFLFDERQDGARARAAPRALTLAYDPNDALARALAERIALDARAAGLQVRPVGGVAGDARVARIAVRGPGAREALAEIAAALGAPPPERVSSPEATYAAERRLRDSLGIIPLVHVPVAFGVAARVKNWTLSPAGDWRLADVWVEEKP